MKRWLSLTLALILALTLAIPAAAADNTPTPPSWVKAEEYAVLPGDAAYSGEIWQRIVRLREDAAAGHPEPQSGDALYDDWNSGEKTGASAALRFELGLIGMKYTENSSTGRKVGRARRYFSLAEDSYLRNSGGSRTDRLYYQMRLWYLRALALEATPSSNRTFSGLALEDFLRESGFTMEQFRDCPALKAIPDTEWADIQNRIPAEKKAQAEADAAAKIRVTVTLDGVKVDTEGLAKVVGGRTMIPVRCLTEQLGAEVSYDSARKAARISRAGVEIIMPIGSKTCTVNGKPFQMDIAPYVESGRTMIPARYVSELFGQRIEWVPDGRIAAVTEDRSLAGDTNLEPWAMAMSAYLNARHTGTPQVFGGRKRGTMLGKSAIGQYAASGYVYTYDWARYLLSDSWGITSREELIRTVCSMTYHGHNEAFLEDAEMIRSWTPAQYQQVLKNAQGMDAYMFPYTKQLSGKWGSRGILCWDLFRMSNLVQWGYAAGYVTYPEALALLEPAAALLRDNFKNWNEACENYLDGYNWWAREDVGGKDPWTVTRGPYLKRLMENYRELFDDSLFQTPVRGVPGLTAEGLLASVQ